MGSHLNREGTMHDLIPPEPVSLWQSIVVALVGVALLWYGLRATR